MHELTSKKRNRSLAEAFSQQIFKTNELGWSQIIPITDKQTNINTTMSSMMYTSINKKNNLHKRFLTLKIQDQILSSSQPKSKHQKSMFKHSNKKKYPKGKENSLCGQPSNNIKMLKLQKTYLQQQDEDDNMFPKEQQFEQSYHNQTFYKPQVPQLRNINLNTYTINNISSKSKYNLNLKSIKQHLSLMTKEKSLSTMENTNAKKYYSKPKINMSEQQKQKENSNVRTKIEFVMPFRKYFKANRKKANNNERRYLKIVDGSDRQANHKILNIEQK